MFYVQIAILGVVTGAAFALSGTGLVLTYQATGVFNISHFATALLAGYLGWQFNGVWGIPLVFAVPLVLLICGPLLGLVLERVVFRPLQIRGAGGSEKLVAALGATVVILGVINSIWGPGVQGTVDEPVPRIFPITTIEVGSLIFDYEQIGTFLLTVVVAGLLFLLLQRSRLGIRIRAVVDRRELAELTAVDANRVSQVAWAIGSTIAAITGLLIPQGTLEPTRIIFFGIETFSVAVVASLASIPVALLFGLFFLGMGRSLLDVFEPGSGVELPWDIGTVADLYQGLITNLSSVVLFAALIVLKNLGQGTGEEGAGLAAYASTAVKRAPISRAIVGIVLILIPLVLTGSDLRAAHRFAALAIIFVSIVAITGLSGHLTLGQASIAGLGAFAAARFANSLNLPVIVAMLLGAGVAALAGFVAGYPALRRRGLFLGLTTLGLGLLIDRFVFNEQFFQGGPGGLTVVRPSFFGLDLASDSAFYYYELVVLGLAVFVTRNLRMGRLGRMLGAMRDSENAAQSVGIELRRAKLFVFGVSSAMAGIGGAVLTQADQTWDTTTFNPVLGLFWFTAVVVAGLSSIAGGLLAAALFTFVPHFLDLDITSAAGFFGFGALFLGRLRGGLVGLGGRLREVSEARLGALWSQAKQPEPEPEPEPELTPLGERLRERVAAR